MGMTDKSLCDSCTNIGCEFQSGIVRTKCAFYMPPQLKPDNCGNYVVQDSTTKNDIRDNRVKNELNRVKDELESTTKNDLGDDCVRRKAVLNTLDNMDSALDDEDRTVETYKKLLKECYKVLPSVTPQEPRWIPMVRREPTDEEKAEYLAQNGEELCYMFESEMPLNGQEVLVSSGGYVSEDVFDEDFYNFENQDIENVDAWMPLPQPYKAESEET